MKTALKVNYFFNYFKVISRETPINRDLGLIMAGAESRSRELPGGSFPDDFSGLRFEWNARLT